LLRITSTTLGILTINYEKSKNFSQTAENKRFFEKVLLRQKKTCGRLNLLKL